MLTSKFEQCCTINISLIKEMMRNSFYQLFFSANIFYDLFEGEFFIINSTYYSYLCLISSTSFNIALYRQNKL